MSPVGARSSSFKSLPAGGEVTTIAALLTTFSPPGLVTGCLALLQRLMDGRHTLRLVSAIAVFWGKVMNIVKAIFTV